MDEKQKKAKVKSEKRAYLVKLLGKPVHFRGEDSIEDVIARHNATVRRPKSAVLKNTGDKKELTTQLKTPPYWKIQAKNHARSPEAGYSRPTSRLIPDL